MSYKHDSLYALEAAYLLILQMPHDMLRTKNQPTYCLLRDTIALLTGIDAEVIQCDFERLADDKKHYEIPL